MEVASFEDMVVLLGLWWVEEIVVRCNKAAAVVIAKWYVGSELYITLLVWKFEWSM